MTPFKRFLAILDRVLEATGAVFGILIGASIVLIGVDIGVRYFGIGSLPWLIEIVEYMLCGGTFLAAPWVLRQNAHVRVDILLTALPRAVTRRIEQLIDLIGCGIAAVLLYYGGVAALQAWRADAILFKTWWTPEWVVLLPVPIACVLLLVEFVLRFLRVEGVVSDEIDPAKRASI